MCPRTARRWFGAHLFIPTHRFTIHLRDPWPLPSVSEWPWARGGETEEEAGDAAGVIMEAASTSTTTMLSFATGTSVTAATISAAVTACSTAQSIAAVPPIVTERQPADSAAGYSAPQSPTGHPTPAKRFAGNAANVPTNVP